MSDCVFCKIVTGQMPSTRVFEDEHSLAFMDIGPIRPGHALLIPKKACFVRSSIDCFCFFGSASHAS